MHHPINFSFDEEVSSFLKESPEFTMDMIHPHLDNHLAQRGFPILIHNVDLLNQEEFAESRSKTFGASDAPVLLGVAYSSAKVPMKTVEELLFEKANKVWDEEIGKKAAVRKGRELEPMLIDKVSKSIDGIVIKPQHTYWNENGLATNFDGVVMECHEREEQSLLDCYHPVPMEIKVCSFFGRANYNWNKGIHELDENLKNKLAKDYKYVPSSKVTIAEHIIEMSNLIGIPKYYYVQVQQQIHFLDAPHGYLAVMDDINWDMYYYKVPKDERTINTLLEKSNKVYKMLQQML